MVADSSEETSLSPYLEKVLSDDEKDALRERDGWSKGVAGFCDEGGWIGRRTNVWVKDEGEPDGATIFAADGSDPERVFAYYSRGELEADDFLDAGWVITTQDADW